MELTEDIIADATNTAATQTARFTWLRTSLFAVDALWAGLRQPWLLVLSGLVVVLLLASAMLLPQLPGELRDDPTAARRWLASVSAEFSGLGALARTLGLFNILHSVALLVVLVVVGLVLFVHLGDMLAAAARLNSLSQLLVAPAKAAGQPLPANPVQPLHRMRMLSAQPTEYTVETIHASLAGRFDQVEIHTAPLAPRPEGSRHQPPATSEAAGDTATATEVRLLATRHRLGVMLRPALMLGLLLTLVVVWLVVIRGWEVTAPILAPGNEYRFNPQQLQMQYTVTLESKTVHPVLSIRLRQLERSLVVTDTTLNLGGVVFRLQPNAPGLHIASLDGTSALARAGQTDTSPGIGLIFPSPGSEEAIILPEQSVGLRIVRIADTASPTFMVEVYDGDRAQPAQRVEIEATQIADIQVNEQGFVLRVLPVPGVVVSAQYLPALWLLWPALILVLVGSVGYWRRPAFILVQVAPWAAGRTVMVAQSDRRQELEQISQQLANDDRRRDPEGAPEGAPDDGIVTNDE